MSKTIKIQNKGWEEVVVPQTPNFIRRPSDGFPIPVQELSEKQLRAIGKAWTDELVTKALQRAKGSVHE